MLNISNLFIRIPSKPSKIDYYWLHGVHALALVASFFNQLPLMIQFGVAVVVCLHWLYTMHRFHSISDSQTQDILMQAGGQWLLRDEQGNEYNAELLPSTVNTPLLVILHLDLGSKGKRFIAIHRGRIEADLFRQLRVALNIRTQTN